MNNSLFKINCLTNLHVGSGDSNYGIIDNLVQRDVLTGFPMINESSLKGSLKEFFVNEVKIKKESNTTKEEAIRDSRIRAIFGNHEGQGGYKFYAGQLLLFPVRSDKTPYLLATCPGIIKDLCDLAEVMGLDCEALRKFSKVTVNVNQPFVFRNDLSGHTIEYPEIKTKESTETVPSIFNRDKLVLMEDTDFKRICGVNKLPVIARNHLEDGKSTNLWYEEIVPRKSVFYCFIGEAATENGFFQKSLEKPLQIGANASIGYGLVKFEKVTAL